MADPTPIKISEFPNLNAVSDSTIFPVLDSGTNLKVTADKLKTYIGASGAVGATGPAGVGINIKGSTSTVASLPGSGNTFVFQNPGFSYTVDGYTGNYPVLTLVRGRTYVFNFTAVTSGHPIALRLSNGNTSTVPGAQGNDAANGVYGVTVTYTVPEDAPNSIVYQCRYHSSMIGTINIVAETAGNTAGDAYIVEFDGHLYVWNDSQWVDSGRIVGPTGPAGTDSTPLPTQTGNSGKYLTTDGNILSWATVTNSNVSANVSETLVWETVGSTRTLSGYKEGSVVKTIRSAEFLNNKFTITLAEFTPTIGASALPSNSLNWDISASGFSVTANNPSDFASQYISSVKSITATSGSISNLSTFVAAAYSASPAGGVNWTRQFASDASSYIRPQSTTVNGGTASADVVFNYNNGSSEVEFTVQRATFTVNWATPTTSVSLSALSGQTFLSTYTSTSYTVSVTGITNSSNYVHNCVATGGTLSSATGSGTMTFTDPVHKDNAGVSRSITNTTTLTRPANVTGTSYSVQVTANSALSGATFTYPTVWLWTNSTATKPTRSDIVSGTAFAGSATQLGNQVKTFSGVVNNSAAVPRVFWFAVRASTAQPSTFKTGASSSLLSDVVPNTGSTVGLAPDSIPSGYTPESYNLYGITLQPGNTYVSIA